MHLLRILILVGAALLCAVPARAHSYGFVATDLNTQNPHASAGTTVWDSIPSSSERWGVLSDASDATYMMLVGSKAASQSCIVKTNYDTTISDLAGSDRRLDSIRVTWRIKDDGNSGKVAVYVDSGAGTVYQLDTAVSTTSWVTHTSTKLAGISKRWITTMRVWLSNPDAVSANDTLFCSRIQVQAYSSRRSGDFLIYHDTADFRIGQISNNETFDDVWTGNRLFFGAYGADSVRLGLSIVNVDTLRTASSTKHIDSAWLNIMTDSVVGAPGYTDWRRPVAQTADLENARAFYHGRIDDDSACHSDWDHYHASAEGASQICADTISWTSRGVNGELTDYFPSTTDTQTFVQSTTKRINITDWIRLIFNTPAGLTGGFSKHYYNGQVLNLPAAEYAAHATRDTLEVSADGDTVAWSVSPGSGADYLYVDEVAAATDSVVRLIKPIETTVFTKGTELFNFPDDTAWGATLDSIRILVHARYNQNGGDCAPTAADSMIFWYDTVAAAGRTRLSKFTLTGSWSTYTSAKITSPSKAAIANLQAGFYNYGNSCEDFTAANYHEVAWIAVERFFATTNKRVKVGNVRPLTANDSSWIDIYYTDVGALHSNPGAGTSDKVVNYADTSQIVLSQIDQGSQSSADGLSGLSAINVGQSSASAFRHAALILRDTNAIADSFPISQYVIDSAKINLYVGTVGGNFRKTEVKPMFRGWRPAPRRTRESAFLLYPLSLTSRTGAQSTYSSITARRTLAGDTLFVNQDGDSTAWTNVGGVNDASTVDERVFSTSYTTDFIRLPIASAPRGELFNFPDDTMNWRGQSNILPDSIVFRASVRLAKTPSAGDSIWFLYDTTAAAGGAVILYPAISISGTTAWQTKTSAGLTGWTNAKIANLQLGVYSAMSTAFDTAFVQGINAVRYYPNESPLVNWISSGAADSTTTDSADVHSSIDSVMWATGDANAYKAGIYVTAWADSMQKSYGASPTKSQWGNAVLLRNSGVTSYGTANANFNNVYPRQSNAALATELHVWASDTTGGEPPPIKWGRRRKIIEQGAKDHLLKAAGWLAIEAEQPKTQYEFWCREARVMFGDMSEPEKRTR